MVFVKAGSFDAIKYSRNRKDFKRIQYSRADFNQAVDTWEPLGAAVSRVLLQLSDRMSGLDGATTAQGIGERDERR